ncbi:MAG: GWxTD domain-containing protein, partial [Bacteroidales bacterium]|nr:GWxTD domain-containing protein [Bacteroidales bacterium]
LMPAIVAAVIAIAGSCRATRPAQADPKDVSYLYNPLNNPFNPRFRIFNESSDVSTLSVKLFTPELFFTEANPTGVPLASLTITVRLYNDSQGGVLADTAFTEHQLNKNLVGEAVIFEIPLTTYDGFEYTAEVRIIDNVTRRMVQAFVKFDRMSEYSSYNFKVRDHISGNEVFTNVLRKDEYVNLIYPGKKIDTVYVHYYSYFNYIPHPPSMMLPERTIGREPVRTIPVAWSDTLPIMFPGRGIYLCSIDSSVLEGYTFFNFGEEYPELTRPETMIGPLEYIATAEEMALLRSAEKPKMALDEFWINRSTNIEKSRELLRIYYNRVLFANQYFTSYKEGWRTDRGMIYILYGPPDKVYKGSAGEEWGYKKPVVKSTWGTRYKLKEEYLWFTFRQKPGRFTTNDFYLNRDDATPTYWDQAVTNWRKGIVFRLDNPEDF